MYGSYKEDPGSDEPATPHEPLLHKAHEVDFDEENMEGRPPMSMRGWAVRVGVMLAATGAVSMSAKGLTTASPGSGSGSGGLQMDSTQESPVDLTQDAGASTTPGKNNVPGNGVVIGEWQADALLSSITKVGYNPFMIFGHENSDREGQYFWDNAGMDMHSDVFNTTGQYPGMYGFSFQDIVDGKTLTNHVLNAAKQNAVIEFFWEADNPVTLGNARDGTGKPCASLLPGGKGNAVWNSWMDTIIDQLLEYKIGENHVPIILRLFHECTESWYWWGDEYCDSTNYKAAWNYTRWYFSEHAGLKNILYVYAPAKVSETEWQAYTNWYPGTDQVDIIGFDRYAYVKAYKDYVQADCEVACGFAQSEGKPCALAETGIADGIENAGNSDWYMNDLLDNLMNSSDTCRRLSYMLTWSNENVDRYWVPLPDQMTAPGFIEFAKDKRTAFAGDYRVNMIYDTYGYSFKTPGEEGDKHDSTNSSESESGPRPIDATTPMSGTKAMLEEMDFMISRPDVDKDWGPYDPNAAHRLRDDYVSGP